MKGALLQKIWILVLALLFSALVFSSCTCGGEGDDDTADDDAEEDGDADDDIDYAIKFPNAGAYVIVSNSDSLQGITSGLTVEAWVKVLEYREEEIEQNIISKAEGTSIKYGFFLRFTENDKPQFSVFNGESDTACQAWSDEVISTNEWHHIAGTFDGDFCSLFIDGVLVHSSASEIDTIGNTTVDLYFGDDESTAGAGGFIGLLDEVRISNVARYSADFTPEPILELDSNTISLWHFNEGEGDIAYDSSDNGNDGTLNGAEWVVRE